MSAGSPPKILPSCVSQKRSCPDDFALFSVTLMGCSNRPPGDTCCESELSPVLRYQYETTGSACFGILHSRNWIARIFFFNFSKERENFDKNKLPNRGLLASGFETSPLIFVLQSKIS